jgi:hypothetical protein
VLAVEEEVPVHGLVDVERRPCRRNDRYSVAAGLMQAHAIATLRRAQLKAAPGELFHCDLQQPVRTELGDDTVDNAVDVTGAIGVVVVARE